MSKPTPRRAKRAKGKEFKPREPYTHRLRKILEEYPDGSQVLREILQNSDDAKSTEQIFILDYNTYPSNSLFEPDLVDNYQRTDLELNRYQGPALLARNNTVFEERDFQSLLKLADSEKIDQFDKIGVMGVGFNSIYHITDSPSFITGDKYVILDPHEWYFSGGVQFDFVDENLAEEYPDQFVPFRIPCDKPFKGTIFRYPLRTNEDSIDSNISKKIYKLEDILDMFQKFYENESINCLLFLKYIERISFYVLKEGAAEPELLYTIQLENANQVREQRRLIAENVVSMMNSLNSKKLDKNNQLQASYVASFSRQGGDCNEASLWLILNYLDDLNEAQEYFQEKFEKNIRDYKFVPNVGLAIPLDSLNNLNVTGRLFCFLPLPLSMPFRVSVHGYFAVSTNRRSLWSAADNEDLATDALARLKVTWNRYLFENVLPKAWVEFLRKLSLKVANIRSDDLYKFWPIAKEGTSGSISNFCKDLLQNVINCLSIEDRVFKGPSSSNRIGTLSEISAESYNASESKFHWLSLSIGYFEDERLSNFHIPKIIGEIGFPVISVPRDFIRMLKNSRHRDNLRFFSPAVIRTYLDCNRDRWENTMPRGEILQLFDYILKDKKFDKLVGFKMIPLADGTLGTITKSSDSYAYIGPNDDIMDYKNDERNIFKNQLHKFIDKSIDFGLYKRLYDGAKSGWNLNIKILDEFAVVDMIIFSLRFGITEVGQNLSFINIDAENENSEEIQVSDRHEWIYQLWENLKYRNWNLTMFEEIHLIPTNRSTLRKLKTPQRIFSNRTSKNILIKSLIPIFEKFGGVFVDNEFDVGKISKWDKISPYIIKLDDIISVLNSFRDDTSYPENLNHALQNHEASTLVEHLSIYLRLANKHYLVPKLIEVIKHLPIFIEVDHPSPISLLPGNQHWFLLPRNEETSYGKVIYPRDKGKFLSACSQNLYYILEDIIKVPRLAVYDYWRRYVIPFLESQQPNEIDIVIDKLFDRLQFLLDQDVNLKDVLGKISFIPVGTFKMSQQQNLPTIVKLVKPIELFDPEEKTIVDLFFVDEQVFPIGNYSKKFLSNLKLLGIKSALSPNDVISRINTIITQRRTSNVQETLIYTKALKLFKYIDDNWDKFNIDDTQNRIIRGLNNNSNAFLRTIQEKEWIPAIDASEKIIFSSPRNCYNQKHKDLICLVSPVIDYRVKNKKFLKNLGWSTYPEVGKVLEQLGLCYKGVSSKQPPKNLERICAAIYKYMNEAFEASAKDYRSKEEFYSIKRYLKDKPWILCGGKFYPTEKVVFNLPNKFQSEESLIVELPSNISVFKPFFKFMGVRDEVGVRDLILVIKDIVKGDKNKILSKKEIDSVIQILEQITKIRKDNKREGNELEVLDGLLVPSNENILVELCEIHFDDMKGRLDEEARSKHKIANRLVTTNIAEELKIQTLTGKIYGNTGKIDWEIYEQSESLTTRINNIIKDYSPSSLFKEFLQNADDAKAKCFHVTWDERQIFQRNALLLSEEMKDWQGPAIWIYNDAEFTDNDFQALIKLGVGGKSEDDTKIGKFGVGFNCAFHLTDLPSFVSGKYIVFLDPNARYLPAQGYPPRRPRGTRIDFIETELKKNCPDQCYPYEALGCDFSKEFKGTLFRLPLRTLKLANQSEISNRVFETKEILRLFNDVQSNKEMLFLRNIESYSLHCIGQQTPQQTPQLIWKTQINMPDDSDRDIRKSVTHEPQVYQMDMEILDRKRNKKISEIWLLCTGGINEITKSDLKEFSKTKRLKPRGGIASLLAQSDKKSLDELRAESFPNPPELRGEIYSYLSLSISTNLGVHLNGNFSLSSARSNILQSENDFLLDECDDSKWNRYILYDVLPPLHIRLLVEIVKLEEVRFKKDKTNFIPHILNNFWPITKNLTMGLYKSYGLNVIKKIGNNNRIFWTEADGGKFVSLTEGKIIEEETMIADILADLGVPILKLDMDKLQQFKEITSSKRNLGFNYTTINGQLACDVLQKNKEFIYSFMQKVNNNDDSSGNKKNIHESVYLLLRFILNGIDESFENLIGLPLVPLSNGSVGRFGDVYYIVKQKYQKLFPKFGPSKFIRADLPSDLLCVFKQGDFSARTNIKAFDAAAILDLLSLEFPNKYIRELDWNPYDKYIPNRVWLDAIWSKLLSISIRDIDFANLSNFPLLPIIRPYEKLVRPDTTNPLLYFEVGFNLNNILIKLKLRFTNMKFSEYTNSNLKQCILSCIPVNIINSLERIRISLNLDMKQLFETNLSVKDYEEFRAYIKKRENLNTLIKQGRKDDNFMKILRSLPIWPIHSCDDEFIDAESGILLPYKLPFFSFQQFQQDNFYKCDELDFNALFILGAKEIDELKYVIEYFIPQYINTTPTENYITFLQSVLSLGNREIEQYFEHYSVIPNKSLETLVKANTLYDLTVPLFCIVFEGTDNFLPTIFYNNPLWLAALKRIGLKYQVNSKTFIECAREIESQFHQHVEYPVVKQRAKSVIDYLYANILNLNFTSDQLIQIMNIKFIPSDRCLQGSSLYEEAKETSGLESFAVLCFQRYKDICWTQRPLFDKSVEPTDLFQMRCPGIGKPSPKDIIDHWSFVVDKIKSKSFNWRSSENYDVIKRIIKEIYEIMNKFSQVGSLALLAESIIEEKLFLNGEDPFDEENWVSGGELVFGVQEDIRKGLYKVHESLISYEDLLRLFRAYKLEEIDEDVENELDIDYERDHDHDQKNLLFNNLLNKLVNHPDTKHHDVIFVVGEEGSMIGASRYVLSAASKYYEKQFCGYATESIENRQIIVTIDDVQSNSFRVFLRLLYGQSFETAKNSILRKKIDFNSEEEDYNSYYLLFLVNLLKITNRYEGETLKKIVEDKIIKSRYINVNNVCEILLWANESKALKLENHCEKYIEKNKHLIVEKKLECCENTLDEEEREEESQMLENLLNN